MSGVTTVTEIALILFDLNGMPYRYQCDDRIAYLSSVTNLPAAKIKAAIWDSGFEDTGDTGTLDASAYLHGCLNYPLSEAEWMVAQQAAVTPIRESLALLSGIRPDVRCAVLTNNNFLVKRHFSTLYPEITSHGRSRLCLGRIRHAQTRLRGLSSLPDSPWHCAGGNASYR
jgi:hypothetical protein